MRRLAGPIRRLERQLAPGGCAVCRGQGRHRIELHDCTDADGHPRSPALVQASGGCPRCGKVSAVKQIILEARPAGGVV